MATVDIKLSKDWKRFERLVAHNRFAPDHRRKLKSATSANGRAAKSAVRKNLKSNAQGLDRNMDMTIAIKGSNSPGVDSQDMLNAVRYRTIDDYTGEVGILKGDKIAGTAIAVHEGANVPVTEKMRALFDVLAGASDTGRKETPDLKGRAKELFERRQTGWRPLAPGTRVIRIPPRPFIGKTIAERALKNLAARNWLDAHAAAIAGTDFNPRRS